LLPWLSCSRSPRSGGSRSAEAGSCHTSPKAYSGYIGGGFRFRLPLTIYNTGARSLVVTDLRLSFVDLDATAPVITFRLSLKPKTDDVEDFAHPFAVPGRSAVSRFVEFGTNQWEPAPDTWYRLRVEARPGDDGEWSELVEFELLSPPREKAHAYIAHRRDPADDAPPPDVVCPAVCVTQPRSSPQRRACRRTFRYRSQRRARHAPRARRRGRRTRSDRTDRRRWRRRSQRASALRQAHPPRGQS
jgi:hypothetical protein